MATPATATTVAGSGAWEGFADGPAAGAQFNRPYGVAVAPNGSYFVADFSNHAVRRVASDGAVTTVAGTGMPGGTDGAGEVATFNGPIGIAVDWRGTVFVTEQVGHRVRKIARTAAGGWAVSTVLAAGLKKPKGIAVDPAGHLVVADSWNQRVVRVDPATGALAVIAGDGTKGFRDGPGATARFNHPVGVAVDHRGDIFVTDCGGRRVRRICAADGVVTTVAGTGVRALVDGAGAEAKFEFPRAIAVDGRGVLLVGDGDWGTCRLRRVAASADRAVSTVAIVGVLAPTAYGIAIDRDGSLLVAVTGANRIVRVTGLGLVPPSAPPWSLRAHRGLAAAAPEIETFVATVMLCASRLDTDADENRADAVPRLPVEMWLAILSMLRPDQMTPRRFSG